MPRPRILCVSLSPIERDSRVLRQISVLAEFGDVTSIGYGATPAGVTHHVEIPGDLPSLPQTVLGVARLALRQLATSEIAAPAARFALKALAGETFDLVVSNDARVLALSYRLARGAPVWADLHEWAPEERTHVLSWRLLVAPLMTHLCARYLPLVSVTTTVCEPIAALYKREFGVLPLVMRNSARWQPLAPSATGGDRIRLVHSGGAILGRSLETMIDVVLALDERYTLDLFLVPAADGGRYLAKLKARARDSHRIVFQDPVPPAQIASTLNEFDVGVFWIPPTHTNAELTLPNKFFDYVQARLAIAVGPTVEMARLVNEHGLGVVSTGYTVDECRASIVSMDREAIDNFKHKSDSASGELAFENDAEVARRILRRLLPPARPLDPL